MAVFSKNGPKTAKTAFLRGFWAWGDCIFVVAGRGEAGGCWLPGSTPGYKNPNFLKKGLKGDGDARQAKNGQKSQKLACLAYFYAILDFLPSVVGPVPRPGVFSPGGGTRPTTRLEIVERLGGEKTPIFEHFFAAHGPK